MQLFKYSNLLIENIQIHSKVRHIKEFSVFLILRVSKVKNLHFIALLRPNQRPNQLGKCSIIFSKLIKGKYKVFSLTDNQGPFYP